VLASLMLPACHGAEGEHGGHGDHVQVLVGRRPPAPPKQPEIDPAALREKALKLFGVLPKEFPNSQNPLTDAKIELGRMLYFDGRLSKNGQISCNSCHVLDAYGVDSLPTSPGHEGKFGERNSPTVYNAAAHLSQFWDGRAADVEAQAKGPVLNPIEMGMPDEASVVAVLAKIPGYVEAFKLAFPDDEESLTYDNMSKAIGAFERRLATPAPIDAWLSGDDKALSPAALAGFKLFMDTDCQSCHSGFNFGGTMYQKLGTENPWPGLEDEGRVIITADERDRFVFKVPSLRNIEKTGPYMHDGSMPNLRDMVAKMVAHQTKRKGPFSDEEMANMLAFLASLTGELPTDYIKKPELPMDPVPVELREDNGEGDDVGTE
jgi:cytochrome c peroxidase